MHHAYLIPQKIEEREVKNFALDFLKLKNEEVEMRLWSEGNFKIESAREVIEVLGTRAPKGVWRVICLSFVTMNDTAQNTLLKIVEEPGENTVFFFITNSVEKILPTLRSRLEIISFDFKNNLDKESKKKSLKELLKESNKIIESIKDEKADKEVALAFMDEILLMARKNKKSKQVLGNLLEMRSYILDQSSSLKQILESAILLAYGI